MKLDVTPVGDPLELMLAEIRSAEIAATRGVGQAAKQYQRKWRSAVSGSLGRRLSNAIRMKNYPTDNPRTSDKFSINAASIVYAQPNRKKWGSAADVIDAHMRGVTIRAVGGMFMAIPIGPAAEMRGKGNARITPQRFMARTGMELVPIKRPGKPILLVAKQARITSKGKIAKKGGRRRKSDNILSGEQWIPAFILVKQVRLKKRVEFNFDRELAYEHARMPGYILGNWKDVVRG